MPYVKQLAVTGLLTSLVLVVAGPASAQLAVERLFLLPQIETGPGQVRLQGMGGFDIAVPDENNEINLWDYSANPAGYSDDRDSWSLDTRVTHNEYVDRSFVSTRDDLNFNTAVLDLGYHSPGNIGVGGRLDFSSLTATEIQVNSASYQLSGFSLFLNKYLGRRLSLGAGLSIGGESRDELTPTSYRIDHQGDVLRGTLGVAVIPAAGVMLAAKYEGGQAVMDGESVGPFHSDSFEWTRPQNLFSIQGFVKRGRLNLGIDYSQGNLQGEETVRASWSQRFEMNPTNGVVVFEATTFTEERDLSRLKARAFVDVIPKKLKLSGAFRVSSYDVVVKTHPNVIGSLTPRNDQVEQSGFAVGAAWTTLASRLLLATELDISLVESTDLFTGTPQVSNRDETVLRAGGEYLIGETVVGRGGLTFSRLDVDLYADPSLNGAYSSTRASIGLGVIPAGAIWQVDFAYDLQLSSDLDTDGSRFSAYLRYLF